jgi:hypothetical protein
MRPSGLFPLRIIIELLILQTSWTRDQPVHLVLRPLFGQLCQPQMIDDSDCRAIGGMRIGRGNRSTRRKPAPVSLCPPQIPHDLTPGSNRGCRGGMPVTNRLSYGPAFARPLPTQDNINTYKPIHISRPRVRFEPTINIQEAKTLRYGNRKNIRDF